LDLGNWEYVDAIYLDERRQNIGNLRFPPDIAAEMGMQLDFLRGDLGQMHGTRIL